MRRTVIRHGFALALAALPAALAARSRGPRRGVAVDMVVIHSTGGPTCDAESGRPRWVKSGSLAANMRFIEAHPTLGIHHMIDRDGSVRHSVPEDELGHHVFHYSARSIAIELVNDGDGVDPYPDPQLAALVVLLRDIVRRHGIARAGIVRHSDLDRSVLPCAPTQRRKVDPGPAFPFDALLDRVFDIRQ